MLPVPLRVAPPPLCLNSLPLNPQVWLLVCYLSPCASLPPADHVAALSAANPQLLAWVYFQSPASLFPQLWCPDGSYSKWGQLFFMPLDVSG